MPTPTGVVRCNITASLTGGEIMVHTLHFRIDPSSYVQDQSRLDLLAGRISVEWAKSLAGLQPSQSRAPSLSLHNETVYRTVDVYSLGADGRSTGQAQQAFAAGVAGGGGAAMPTEVAVCCTLRSGRPGRSQQGRTYLGGLSSSALDGTGKLNTVHRDALANGLASFLSAMGAGTPIGDDPVIYSRLHGSVQRINYVSVGDIFDVQRRRRNALPEARYQTGV